MNFLNFKPNNKNIAQRTLKITRGAKSLRGILNPKNFKNLSSIKTAGAGYVLNSLADVGVRRLSLSLIHI